MTRQPTLAEILDRGPSEWRFADRWTESVDFTWDDVNQYAARSEAAGSQYTLVGTTLSYDQLVSFLEQHRRDLLPGFASGNPVATNHQRKILMPRFTATSNLVDGIEVVSLESDTGAQAKVCPALGANMFALHVRGQQLLVDAPWNRFKESAKDFGAPLLVPFINRLNAGRFTFQGHTHHLRTQRNGLVRNLPWSRQAFGATAGGASVTCQLDSRHHPRAILSQFHFAFVTTVSHRLFDSGVEIALSVENAGDRDMPLSMGLHPYFFASRGSSIVVPADRHVRLTKMIPNGHIDPVSPQLDLRQPRLTELLQLDDLYTGLQTNADGKTQCLIQNGDATTVVEFDSKYVMVFSPPNRPNAVAIEPYSSAIDAHNQPQGGLIVLAPGEKHQMNVKIYLRN